MIVTMIFLLLGIFGLEVLVAILLFAILRSIKQQAPNPFDDSYEQ